MKIVGSTALFTGANRGIGRPFAEQRLARGATVYAAARNPGTIILEGVRPVALNITDIVSVAAAARDLPDVSLLVNNAGVTAGATLISGDLEAIATDLNTNFSGTLHVTRAFAPVLAANGGGTILNMLTALSWVTMPGSGAYCLSKSAEWALTNAVRQELAAQGTQVAAVHVGPVDADFTRGFPFPDKAALRRRRVRPGRARGRRARGPGHELSRGVPAKMSGGVAALYSQAR